MGGVGCTQGHEFNPEMSVLNPIARDTNDMMNLWIHCILRDFNEWWRRL